MNDCCKSCGVKLELHPGIILTCAQLVHAKKRLKQVERLAKRMAETIEQYDDVFVAESKSLKAYKKLMK